MGYKFFYTISIPSMDCLRSDLPVGIGGVLTQNLLLQGVASLLSYNHSVWINRTAINIGIDKEKSDIKIPTFLQIC